MSTRKEVVILRGTLRGGGRQRECRVKVTKNSLFANEVASPVAVAYSGMNIIDSDDFPDGNYEVQFAGLSHQ